MSTEFLLTTLVIVATPGTGVLYTLAAVDDAERQGRAHGGGGRAAVRNHGLARPAVVTWMRRGFGAAFVALAGRLALTER